MEKAGGIILGVTVVIPAMIVTGFMPEWNVLPLWGWLLIAIALGTYMVLQVWSVDVTGWLASAGIVGIAVGFAAKDTLANLFSGVFILADRPYKLGDYVNLSSGERGKVTHIGIRSTRLLTRDDIEITALEVSSGGELPDRDIVVLIELNRSNVVSTSAFELHMADQCSPWCHCRTVTSKEVSV